MRGNQVVFGNMGKQGIGISFWDSDALVGGSRLRLGRRWTSATGAQRPQTPDRTHCTRSNTPDGVASCFA